MDNPTGYLSRITLRSPSAHLREFWSRSGNEYLLHQEIWQWFSDAPDRKRDFHYRVDAPAWGLWSPAGEGEAGAVDDLGPAGGRVTTVSARRPEPSSRLWTVETRSWPPPLAEGQELDFVLRVNPTVWRANAAGVKGRHDVVQDLKIRRRATSVAEGDWPQLIHEAGAHWLRARGLSRGFGVDPADLAVGRYRQVEFGHRRSRIRFGQLDYRGRLRVLDSDAFSPVLLAGIGKSRGFGCGLLELRGP